MAKQVKMSHEFQFGFPSVIDWELFSPLPQRRYVHTDKTIKHSPRSANVATSADLLL